MSVTLVSWLAVTLGYWLSGDPVKQVCDPMGGRRRLRNPSTAEAQI